MSSSENTNKTIKANTTEKLDFLKEQLLSYANLAVAVSGGADSLFLLLFAQKVYENEAPEKRLVALSAEAPNFPQDDLVKADHLCAKNNIAYRRVKLDSAEYLPLLSQHGEERCYYCKKYFFKVLLSELDDISKDISDAADSAAGYGKNASSSSINYGKNASSFVLVDGTNADDMKENRPGVKALEELEIASPLRDAGLTKEEIRTTLATMNIDVWNKPSNSCLATRFQYGDTVDEDSLRSIYFAESMFKDLGFKDVRVRKHGNLARIEIPPEQRRDMFDEKLLDKLSMAIKACGFDYVTLDMEGFKRK